MKNAAAKSFFPIALVLAFILSCNSISKKELSGTYIGFNSNLKHEYVARFTDGNVIEITSPSNGQTFSGTYKIDGNTVLADFGFQKEAFQIVTSTKLKTRWNGIDVELDFDIGH